MTQYVPLITYEMTLLVETHRMKAHDTLRAACRFAERAQVEGLWIPAEETNSWIFIPPHAIWKLEVLVEDNDG